MPSLAVRSGSTTEGKIHLSIMRLRPRTSWHMRLMNSLLASLEAFSLATTRARWAAWARAFASACCAVVRPCASSSSFSAAMRASCAFANICLRTYH